MVHYSSGGNGSLLLEQMVASAACNLLFMAGENVLVMVVTMLKNSGL